MSDDEQPQPEATPPAGGDPPPYQPFQPDQPRPFQPQPQQRPPQFAPQAPYGQPPYGSTRPIAPTPGYQPPWQQQPYAVPPVQHRRSDMRSTWVVVLAAGLSLILGLIGGFVGAELHDNASSGNNSASGKNTVDPPVSNIAAGGRGSPVIAVANKVLPSVVSIDVRGDELEVTGSGFVFDDVGHVVTNNHVIAPAVGGGDITVSFADGQNLSATIVGRSPSYDVAVLQVHSGDSFVPATLGRSDKVQVGESVVAIGSPLGLNSTVTSGIISATHRAVLAGGEGEASYISALQTDAAINPGNSGGPLVDLHGAVVGVNSAIATLGGSQKHQSGSIGVGFAIPIDQVSRTVQEIIKTGHAVYPVIGAHVSVARTSDGARVLDVDSGSPAESAGIEEGDVIEEVNSVTVQNGVELIVTLRTFQPGQTVSMTVLHDGEISSVKVVLEKQVG